MTHLESLDALLIEQNFTEARAKRKTLVLRIQNYLSENDNEEKQITDISSKLLSLLKQYIL